MAPTSDDPAAKAAGLPTPRLLLADVDGTLVTKEKILTERAQAAVRRLREAGVGFAVTSGRPPVGMKMLVGPLAIDTPIAGFNGGLYVKPDFSIIEQHSLKRDVVEKVVEVIRQHRLDVWIYRGNDWFTPTRHGPHVDREEWTVKFPPTVKEQYGPELLDEVAKVVGVSDDLEAVARCEAAVRAAFGQDPHQATPGQATVSAARSQPYYLDVTHPNANKGDVVLTLAKMLRLDPREIATFGDMPNDVTMFVKGGVSIAMGQASDEVKQAATFVTTSSEDEGFAQGVEKYLLPLVQR